MNRKIIFNILVVTLGLVEIVLIYRWIKSDNSPYEPLFTLVNSIILPIVIFLNQKSKPSKEDKATSNILSNNEERKNKSKSKKLKKKLKLVLNEDFKDNRNKWLILNDKLCRSKISNNRYSIYSRNVGTNLIFEINVSIKSTNDLLFEGYVTYKDGSTIDGYGLIWGYNDTDNRYGFLINEKGRVKIYQKNKGTYITFFNEESQSVNTNKMAVNKLVIAKSEGEMYFELNGDLIYKLKELEFYGSKVGIQVSGNVEVDVSKFKIWN